MSSLVLDCDTCVMKGKACQDCLVSVLVEPPAAFDAEEQEAIDVLAGVGLVPRLRMVPVDDTLPIAVGE